MSGIKMSTFIFHLYAQKGAIRHGYNVHFNILNDVFSLLLFLPSARHSADKDWHATVEYFSQGGVDFGSLGVALLHSVVPGHRTSGQRDLHRHQCCGAKPEALHQLRLLRLHS